jgi:hypothetical protein
MNNWILWRGLQPPKWKKRRPRHSTWKNKLLWYTRTNLQLIRELVGMSSMSSWRVITMRNEPRGRKARLNTDIKSTAFGKEEIVVCLHTIQDKWPSEGSNVAYRPVAKQWPSKQLYNSHCYVMVL